MRAKWFFPLLVCAIVATATAPFAMAASAVTKPPVIPGLSVSDGSVVEGNAGTRLLNFTVSLSAPTAQTVSVTYKTQDDFSTAGGNATGVTSPTTPGGDYVSQRATLTFPAHKTEETISVPIIGDTTVEDNELFTIQLFSPVGATLVDPYGTGTIINDDPTPGFQLGIGDASMRAQTSGTRTVQLTVSFSDPAPSSLYLHVSTQDGTAIGVLKTSTPGGDYLSKTNVQVGVPKGTTEKVITLTILPHKVPENTKTFTVNLTSTLGAVIKPVGTVIIRDYSGTINRPGRQPGPPRVSLMGDSITSAYVDTIKPMLEAKGYAVFENSYPGTSILDVGRCQAELETSLVNTIDPDIFVAENRTNYFKPCDPSILVNTPEYYAEWQTVAQLDTNAMLSKGAKVYWMTNPQAFSEPGVTMITNVNSLITNMVTDTPGTTLIDAFTPFGGNTPDPTLRTGDFVHLSLTGEQLMANLVANAVN